MNKRLSAAIILIMALCLLVTLPVCAWADNGNGDKKIPLLDSSSVADGATDVAVDLQQIDLVFTNNVVNIAVKENNLKCFSLKSADGKDVAIEVLMGDDQVDPNAKRNVSVAIAEALEPDTAYILTISGELSAKNGNLLGNDINIGFTTAAAPAEEAPAEEAPAEADSGVNMTWVVIIAAVVILLVVIVFARKKTK